MCVSGVAVTCMAVSQVAHLLIRDIYVPCQEKTWSMKTLNRDALQFCHGNMHGHTCKNEVIIEWYCIQVLNLVSKAHSFEQTLFVAIFNTQSQQLIMHPNYYIDHDFYANILCIVTNFKSLDCIVVIHDIAKVIIFVVDLYYIIRHYIILKAQLSIIFTYAYNFDIFYSMQL